MTSNWAATVVNVLIAGFFLVSVFGIGISVYAALELKKAEVRNEDQSSLES